MSAIPRTRPPSPLRHLRDAAWLNAERARGYLLVAASLLLVITLGWIAVSLGGLDPTGKILGTDFVSFYAASVLSLGGNASSVYDVAAHHAAQTAVLGRDVGYAAFFYPPIYLLLCLPMGLLPYLASLVVWQAGTLLFYWRVARRFGAERLGELPFFVFPAVMVNVGHGQNAFLSAGLFGAGILCLDRRPVLAGVMFGALAYKPHLGLVIPLALAVGRRWVAFGSASATVLVLCLMSLAAFGPDVWTGFLAISKLAGATLEHQLVEAYKMQSLYAAVRLLGGGSGLAYAAQAILAVGVLASLALAIHRGADTLAAGALMATAALLTTPFLLDYDLMLLAIPMAWLFREALRGEFLPWEKVVLLASFVLPLLARPVADALGVPLGPIVVIALHACLLRRTMTAERIAPR